jgi:transposase
VYANSAAWPVDCGMRRRLELTDAQWAQLAPLLPPEKPPTGKPNRDHRAILGAILWKLGTGAPWRDLPERYGPWSTAYSRFRRWRLAGTWDRLFAAVQARADAAGRPDWEVHFVDGTVVRAHQHAAWAKGGTRRRRRSGAARAASRPRCTSGPRAAASR